MHTVHLASTNRHKIKEFTRLFGSSFTLLAPHHASIFNTWIEDGYTFMDNSIKKAVFYSERREGLILADDSGLSVAALEGEPGIHSARYAGPHATGEDNRRLLLARLAHLPEEARAATFWCALALARDGKILTTVEASCPGRIARLPAGTEGFGYDPIFLPSGATATFAQMTPAEKDQYSHRARAVAQLLRTHPPDRWS
ncbi:non-canonical purine NTP pyrophosphatase [Verrucomicrobium sp. 3C]|uniref:non-canonical purine NTP pyrophosphatase n=1 Tax=Verrucomicrobium sp. 3C TaxID=1134055 RepID=UPI0003797B96|nr:non-canonical purine NTP pyrophosphatase [Verrucomicrobium sp. 3C]